MAKNMLKSYGRFELLELIYNMRNENLELRERCEKAEKQAEETKIAAEKQLETARKDHGRTSYQYQMAEHANQSAIFQNASAQASFELAFQKLFQAIAPAQSALAVKQADLTYQEQACAAAELKYQQGTISANALQDAVNKRESARRDVEAARLDLFTAYHSYRQAVEKGLAGSNFSRATAVGLFQSLVGLILVLAADRVSKALGEDGLL